MLACFRIGAVPASCPEQLRAKDLRLRLEAAAPVLIIADERNRAELERATPALPRLVGARTMPSGVTRAAGAGSRARRHPIRCLPHVHLRHLRRPKAVLAPPALPRPASASRPRTGWACSPGDVVWCTAASGWSKSARNVFVAPWLRGGDGASSTTRASTPRSGSRSSTREAVSSALHGADRVPHHRQAAPASSASRPSQRCVAAGEALDPAVLAAWREALGVDDPRRLRADRDRRRLTGFAPGERDAPRIDGPAAARRASSGSPRASCSPTPRTVPTFFSRLPRPATRRARDAAAGAPAIAPRWTTDGYLWFQGRADDIIISAGYRIGPFEVETALTAHPAVEEAAAVARPTRSAARSCALSSC